MKTGNSFQSSVAIEPNTLAFLQALRAKPASQTVEDARRAESSMQAVEVTKPPADIKDLIIPGGPNGTIAIRIVRPKGNNDNLPVVMYFHGGGWVVGGKDTHDRLIREIANGANAVVVFVDYTRSPEARFPVAIEEAYAATMWVKQNGESIKLDPSRLAVVGDSAGGNMAAAVTLLAKERRGPKINFQVLFCPVTDAYSNTPSYSEFDGYFLTREGLEWFWNQYAPDVVVRSQPTVSLLRSSLKQLKELPPALIITAELDMLRDEGESYARRLIEAGVTVTATRYLGTIHAFVVLNPITDTPAPRAAIAQTNDMLRRVFSE